MRIPVDSIDERGREVSAGLGDAWAVRAAATALDAAPEALDATLRVERKGPAIFVRGTVTTRSKHPCDRCAEPVETALVHEVELAYAADPGGTGEIELSEGDLDVGPIPGDMLDLGDVLSESIALALPTRFLCTDTAACDARTASLLAGASTPDTSPFAALAGLVRDA